MALVTSPMWSYVSDASQVTTFNITLSNTGAVTLTDVAVEATASQPVMCKKGDGDYSQLPVASLPPGGFLDCYLKLKPTMQEFESQAAVQVNLSATASASDEQLSSNPSFAVLFPLRNPQLSLNLLRSTCVVPPAPGGNLTCNVQLASTGNVPVYNVTLEEPAGQCSVASLQPGAAHVCTVSMPMIQEVWDGPGLFTWALTGSAIFGPNSTQVWGMDFANFTLPLRPELTMTNSVEPPAVEVAGEVLRHRTHILNQAVMVHALSPACTCSWR
jgi:hypothetical protein